MCKYVDMFALGLHRFANASRLKRINQSWFWFNLIESWHEPTRAEASWREPRASLGVPENSAFMDVEKILKIVHVKNKFWKNSEESDFKNYVF